MSGSWEAPCPYTVGSYQVYGTGGSGLYQHTGPGTGYPRVTNPYTLAEGTVVQITCQLSTSSIVGNSGIWDLETNGHWVSDYYINTPGDGHYSPGLTQCAAAG